MVPLAPLVVAFLAAFLYSPASNEFQSADPASERYLLLTAHPDDEAMFFAPTILGLLGRAPVVQAQVDASEQTVLSGKSDTGSPLYSLCLSVGDADGLGNTRREELTQSLNVLAIDADKRWIVDHPELQDNITVEWDPAVIANVVKPYIIQHQITIILTFDAKGISEHPNHRALPKGAKHLLSSLSTKSRLFTLTSVPTPTKYTGVVDALISKFQLYSSKILIYYDGLVTKGLERAEIIPPGSAPNIPPHFFTPVFVSGAKAYTTAFKAMLAHKSQLVWFRWLYLLFSRYMWVNEWTEVEV